MKKSIFLVLLIVFYSNESYAQDCTIVGHTSTPFVDQSSGTVSANLNWDNLSIGEEYQLQYSTPGLTTVTVNSITSTPVLIENLQANAEYSWRVVPKCNGSWSQWPNAWEGSFTTPDAQSCIITGHTSTPFVDQSSGTVSANLNWDNLSIGEEYQLQYSTSGLTTVTVNSITSTPVLIENLQANAEYSWRVVPKCNGSWSQWPNAWEGSFTTPDAQSCIITGHTSTPFVDQSSGTVSANLNWDNLSIGEEYQLQYSTPGLTTVTVNSITSTPVLIENLQANAEYSWRVVPKCNGSWSQWPNAWEGSFTTPDAQSCIITGHTSTPFVDQSSGTVSANLNWDNLSIGEEYQLQYSTPGLTTVTVNSITSTPVLIENLQANAEYSWRVVPKCNGSWSQWPNAWEGSFTTPDAQSCIITGHTSTPFVDQSSGTVSANLNWDNLSIGEEYQLQYSTPGLTTVTVNSITSTPVLIENLQANAEYSWRVVPKCNGSWSQWPNAWEGSFTTPDAQSCIITGHTSTPFVDQSSGTVSANLNWDNLSIGEEYQLQYSTPGLTTVTVNSITSTPVLIENLQANAEYSWRVVPKCNGSWSQWPNAWEGSFTTPQITSNYPLGAEEIPFTDGWTSGADAYNMAGLTATGAESTCRVGPNRWHKFTAQGNYAKISSNTFGHSSLTLFYFDGNNFTQMQCVNTTTNTSIEVTSDQLVPGQIYFLSLTASSPSANTYDLKMETNISVDSNYPQGAEEIPFTDGWTSGADAYNMAGLTATGAESTCRVGPNRWHKFTAQGNYAKISSNTFGHSSLTLFSFDGNNFTQMQCVNTTTNTSIEVTSDQLVPGQIYFLSLTASSPSANTYDLKMETNISVDSNYPQGAEEIPFTDGWTSGADAYNMAGLTATGAESTCRVGPNRWHKFTAQGNYAKISSNTFGHSSLTLFSFDGNNFTQMQCVNTTTNTSIEVTSDQLVPGQIYYLSLTANSPSAYTYDLKMETNISVDSNQPEGAEEIPFTDGWTSGADAYNMGHVTATGPATSCRAGVNRWHKFTATGNYAKITSYLFRQGTLTLYAFDGSEFTQMQCVSTGNENTYAVVTSDQLVAGQTYYVSATSGAASGIYTYDLKMETNISVDSNQTEGAEEIPFTDGWTSGADAYNMGHVTATGPATSCRAGVNRWHKFTATGNYAKITSYLFRQGTLTLYAFDGSEFTQMQCVSTGNENTYAVVTSDQLVAGQTYYVSATSGAASGIYTYDLKMETNISVDSNQTEGAEEIPFTDGWTSGADAYNMGHVTATGPATSCRAGVNRWHKFTATGNYAKITSYLFRQGTLTLYAFDGSEFTQMQCVSTGNENTYAVVTSDQLVAGQTYYVSATSGAASGIYTYDLKMETNISVDSNQTEGAEEIPFTDGWTSGADAYNMGHVTATGPATSCRAGVNRWHKFTATGNYAKITSYLFRQGTLTLYAFDGSEFTQMQCVSTGNENTYAVVTSDQLVAGQTYYVSATSGAASGIYTYDLKMETNISVDSNQPEGAEEIPFTDGWTSGADAYNMGHVTATGPATSCRAGVNRWHKFTATGNYAKITSYLFRQGTLTLYAFDGSEFTQMQCVSTHNDATYAVVTSDQLVAGQTYYVSATSGAASGIYTYDLKMETNISVDSNQPEGAEEIPFTDGWTSGADAYNMGHVTATGPATSCRAGVNRWHKFTATGNYAKITSYLFRQGTLTLYAFDGTNFTQMQCINTGNVAAEVVVTSDQLVPGQVYYVSATAGSASTIYTYNLKMETSRLYDIQWKNLTNLSVEPNNQLARNNGEYGWDAGASAYNVLKANEEGFIEFTIDEIGSVYSIGLSHRDENVTSSQTDHSFVMNEYGQFHIKEDNNNRHNGDLVSVGDVFRIQREAEFIKYYYNGNEIFSQGNPLSQQLVVDVALYRGSTPQVVSSFDARLEVTPTFIAPTASTNGSISLDVQGGDGNYNYAWSSGETSSSINQPVGEYSVTVTDGKGRSISHSYFLGYDTEWKNLANLSVEPNNQLARNNGEYGWDAGASAYNVLKANEEGFIEFTIDEIGSVYSIGLSHRDENVTSSQTDHSFVMNEYGQFHIKEDNNNRHNGDLVSVGDVFRIQREAEFIKYYYNGNEIFSQGNPLSQQLVVDVALYRGSTPQVVSSFDARLEVTPTFIAPTASTNGSISLDVQGGDGNYNYAWSSGETSSSINQPVGEYSVTVTDGKGRSISHSYFLGYDTEWKNLANLSVEPNNQLARNNDEYGWDAGASAYNVLKANEEGFIEFTIDEIGSVYSIGLSHRDENVTSSQTDHSFVIDEFGKFHIREDNNVRYSGDLANIGDVFKIQREAEFIKYYYNGNEIFSQGNPLSQQLVVDVALYRGSTPQVVSSFDARLEVTPTFIAPTASTNGSISLDVQGGDGNYNYAWSSGETSSSINQPVGEYSVTVTDGKGRSISHSYFLGYDTEWKNLANLSVEPNNQLARNNDEYGWDAGASAYNVLKANEEGFIEFTIDEIGSVYSIGLSHRDENVTSSQTDHSFVMNEYGQFHIKEDNNVRYSGDLANIGDVFKIQREAEFIKYYYNGNEIFSQGNPLSQQLVVDVALYRGSTPQVVSSFDARLEVTPTFIAPTASTNGSISLDVQGGDGNYNYAWSSGETSSSINQPVGEYSVTVTDGKGRSISHSYFLGYDTEWKNLANLSVEPNNQLARNNDEYGWDAGASAYNVLKANEEGFIEFTIDEIGSVYSIGLSHRDENVTSSQTDHSIILDQYGQFYVKEDNNNRYYGDLVSIGDVFRIERENDFVKYYYNGLEIYASPNPISEQLVVDVALYNGTTPKILTSVVPNNLNIIPTITAAGPTSNGSVDLAVSGGTEPYTYAWSSGETTASISQPAGDYSVTVTDATGIAVTKAYHLGYPVLWKEEKDVTVDANNRLVKSTTSTGWDASAASYNVIRAQEEGFIEFTIEEIGSEYTIGMSRVESGTNYVWIQHGIKISQVGAITVHESNSTKLNNDIASIGDIFRISREGEFIRYYQNGTEIYASDNPLTEQLVVDISLAKGQTPIVISSFEPKLEIIPTISAAGPTSNGSVDLAVSGGTEPYTYAWSSGETTASISQPAGDYSVTVTDATGIAVTKAYHLGYPVLWKEEKDVTVDANNRLVKSTTSTGWDASAASYNVIRAQEEGFIEFTIEEIGSEYTIGMSRVESGTNYVWIQHGIKISQVGAITVHESNSTKLNNDIASIGDIFRISREGEFIRYYQNGTEIYASDNPLTEQLVVDISLAKGQTPIVISSFEPKLEIIPTISAAGPTSNGSVDLAVSGGTEPYTYAWSSGETTASISQPAGDYSVTVTDATGIAVTKAYHLGYPVLWKEEKDVTVDANNRLVKSTTSTGWDASAASYNVIRAQEEGFIEFTIEEIGSEYTIGMSRVESGTNYVWIQHGIKISQVGAITVHESNSTKLNNDIASIGDIFRISREGEFIRYYQNGTEIYASDNPLTEQLVVDISLAKGQTPIVISSFEPKLEIIPTISAAGPTSNGSVDLAVSGGTEPYTYAWSSGETTASISQPAGDYSVTVTDATGIAVTKAYHLGYPVLWKEEKDVTVDANNRLVKSTTSTGWDASAASYNVIRAQEEGFIEFTIEEIGSEYTIGMSRVESGTNYVWIQHGIKISQVGAITVHESNSTKLNNDIASIGDIFRISREGEFIRYYQNGTEIYASDNPLTEQLVVDISLAKGQTPIVISSFEPKLEIIPTISAAGPTSNGSVDLAVSGGTEPYTYAWSSGETTASISQPAGDYSVTVTDATGIAVTKAYHLGYPVHWRNEVNVTIDANNRLVKSTTSTGWDAHAEVDDILASGDSGFIEFTLEDIGSEFTIGLSNTESGTNYVWIQHGIKISQVGAITVHESNSTKLNNDIASIGDIFRISREGEFVKYYQNGSEIYSSPNPLTEQLVVDVSLAKGQMPIITSSFQPVMQELALDADEYQALKDLFESTDGANWTDNTGWPYNNWPAANEVTSADLDTWFGVTVTDGDVTEISLPNNNLSGTLSNTIQNLAGIQIINLSENAISAVPLETMNLSQLSSLDVSANELESIPDFSAHSNATALTLNLDNNFLDVEDLNVLFDVSGNPLLNEIHYQNQKANLLEEALYFADYDWFEYSISLSGSNYSYQWQKFDTDWADVGDSNDGTLLIEEARPGDAGSYRCLITNSDLPQLTITTNETTLLEVIGSVEENLEYHFYALKELYINTDGDNWINRDGWPMSHEMDQMEMFGEYFPMEDISNFYGITVSGMMVSEINLSGNNLVGEIPEFLGQLIGLKKLDLSQNELEGSITDELEAAENLKELNVSQNQLDGDFPFWIPNMSKLQKLDLSKNGFHGSIPTEINGLIELGELNLSQNQFTGSIPVEIGDLSMLKILDLNNNQLSGSIPVELEQMTTLEKIDLSFNNLTGQIPGAMNGLVQLHTFNIQSNQIDGVIPGSLSQISTLKNLNLSENNLSGQLPNTFVSAPELEVIDVSANQLTAVPNFTFHNDQESLNVKVQQNKLSFESLEPYFDEEITSMNLQNFEYAPQGDISVDVSIESGEGEGEGEGGPEEGGEGPEMFAAPMAMSEASATAETIEYSLSDGIEFFTYAGGEHSEYRWQHLVDDIWVPAQNDALEEGDDFMPYGELWIESGDESHAGQYRCAITNSLVPALTIYSEIVELEYIEPGSGFEEDRPQFEALRDLFLATDGENWENTYGWPTVDEFEQMDDNGTFLDRRSYANWTGITASSETGMVTSLVLQDNGLAGSLPSSIGDLTALTVLEITDSELNAAPLPAEIGNLTELTILRLTENQMTGPIPVEIGNLTKLRILDLNRNDLNGTLPSTLTLLESLEKLILRTNSLTGEISNLPPNCDLIDLHENQFTSINAPNLFQGIVTNINFSENNISSTVSFVDSGRLNEITFTVRHNAMPFDQLEKMMPLRDSFASFDYAFQTVEYHIPEHLVFNPVDGDQFSFDLNIGGANNVLVWEKKISEANNGTWVPTGVVTGPSGISYTIDNPDYSDEGVYRCTITNTEAPQVIFTTSELTLEVDKSLPFIALKDFYTHTNGDTWIRRTNWPTAAEFADMVANENYPTAEEMATWEGVRTDTYNNIYQLYMPLNNLTGEFADAVASLKYLPELTTLNFAANNLTGGIPEFLGNYPSFVGLNLEQNQIEGKIPESILNNTNFLKLDISSTNIEFEIDDFYNMTSLIELDLSNNETPSDRIPQGIGNLASLEVLYLSNLGLKKIPTDFGELTNLTKLNISMNDFWVYGKIFDHILNFTKLQELNLSFNPIMTGVIPDQIGQLTDLKFLILEFCNFTGPIPRSIENLTDLQLLIIGNNEFEGDIPSQIENLNKLNVLDLSHNQLSGSIPTNLSNLQNLSTLNLEGNNLSGNVPGQLFNLIKVSNLNLGENNLTGIENITGDLSSSNLRHVYIDRNNMSGTLSTELLKIPLLTTLNVAENELTDIPVGFFQHGNLQSFNVNNNQIASLPSLGSGAINMDFYISANLLDFNDFDPYFSEDGTSIFSNIYYSDQKTILPTIVFQPVMNGGDSELPVSLPWTDSHYHFDYYNISFSCEDDCPTGVEPGTTFYEIIEEVHDNPHTFGINEIGSRVKVEITSSKMPELKMEQFFTWDVFDSWWAPPMLSDSYSFDGSHTGQWGPLVAIRVTTWQSSSLPLQYPDQYEIWWQVAGQDYELYETRQTLEGDSEHISIAADPETMYCFKIRGIHPGETFEFTEQSCVVSGKSELISEEYYYQQKYGPDYREPNSITSKSFDDQGLIAESKSYFDKNGQLLQSEEKIIADNNVLVTQPLYDRYHRQVGTTLPAPIYYSTFHYKDDFVRDNNGNIYSYLNFDQSDNRENPDPVAKDDRDNLDGGFATLGRYYSDNNHKEPFVDQTEYPYTMQQYYDDGSGEVKRSTLPGDHHKVGSGHELHNKVLPVLGNELPDYIALRSAILGASGTAELDRIYKEVNSSPDGNESVTYYDHAGTVLASAIGNTSATYTIVDNNLSDARFDELTQFHIPENMGSTVQVTFNSGTTKKIFDKLDDDHLVATLSSSTTSRNLPPGIYAVSGATSISYAVNYDHFSYNIYNNRSQLVATITPNGLDQYRNGVALDKIDMSRYYYNFKGQLIQQTEPDAGITNFMYRKDGQIKFSENAQQKIDGKVSYTNYDKLHRPVESGELITSKSWDELRSYVDQGTVLPSDSRLDVIATFYDKVDPNYPETLTDLGYEQENLSLSVSFTENHDVKTWYSYDEMGRVTWMIQYFKVMDKYFSIDYSYDFSGKVTEVVYQKEIDPYEAGAPDETFYHHYEYDRSLRLKKVYTSVDGVNKYLHAEYFYYQHGPLKRVEIAEDLQGIDYVYTVQGWLKSINHPEQDVNVPGGDNNDVFGMTLDYFSGDYLRQSGYDYTSTMSGHNSYDGNIRGTTWNSYTQAGASAVNQYSYSYDFKNQLTAANFTRLQGNSLPANAFKVQNLKYDLNGNIKSLQRRDAGGDLENDFLDAYKYNSNTTLAHNNQLEEVTGYASYEYNAIGQLISIDYDDAAKDDLYLEYDASGKVKHIKDASDEIQHQYLYDDRGFRMMKSNRETGENHWYVRDASGNIIALYSNPGNFHAMDLEEVPIYGDGKLGIAFGNPNRYKYNYELTDHLGTVRSVITKMKFLEIATMETSPAAQHALEEESFANLGTRHLSATNNYTPGGEYAARLNATETYTDDLGGTSARVIGPAKSLQVKAGDKISIDVMARYAGTIGTQNVVTGLAGLVSSSLSITAGGETSQAYNSLNNLFAAGSLVPSSSNGAPKAYVQFLLFDENYTPLMDAADCGCYQVITTAAQNSWEELSLEVDIEQDGYVYVYVANETDENINVWFDDLSIYHEGLEQLQSTDYYPFGAPISALDWQKESYRFGYQGQFAEEDEETGFNHFQLRDYDPIIARWMVVDPARQYDSPYKSMGNRPTSVSDKDGACADDDIPCWIEAFSLNLNVEQAKIYEFGLDDFGGKVVLNDIDENPIMNYNSELMDLIADAPEFIEFEKTLSAKTKVKQNFYNIVDGFGNATTFGSIKSSYSITQERIDLFRAKDPKLYNIIKNRILGKPYRLKYPSVDAKIEHNIEIIIHKFDLKNSSVDYKKPEQQLLKYPTGKL